MSEAADEDHARCLAFLRRGDMAGAREVPTALGPAVIDEARALRHDSNYLVVDRPDVTPDALAGELTRLGLPMAMFPDPAQGERLAEVLAPQGWGVHRGLTMVLRRAPDRPPPPADVREVPVELLRPLRRALLLEYPWATPEVADQLLDVKAEIARRVRLRAYAALEEGAVVSYADVYSADGVAQVEDVATAPAHRNRGLSRAVLGHAIAAAREDGATFVFLVAADDDWPKELYRKLGFDEVGRYVKLIHPDRV